MPSIAEGCSAEATIANGGAATAIVTVDVLFSDGVLASLSATLTEKFPLTVGIPEIIPVVGARDTPDGSLPAVMLHVYPGVPPVASSTTT